MRPTLTTVVVFCLAVRATAQVPAGTSCETVERQIPDSLVIPMEVQNNHIYVSVCVGSRALSFILDTGAGQSFMDLAVARDLGLSTGSTFSARGAGQGTIGGAQLEGASVTLAGTGFRQRIGAALDLGRLPERAGLRMDGILGADFIASRVLAIDYATSRLRLYDRAKFRYTGGGASLPITIVNGHPHVDGEIVLSDGETLRGRFVIDVGSGGNFALAKPFVDDHNLRTRVGPTLQRPGGVGVGGATMAVFGRVAELRLGSIVLRDVVTGLYGDSAGVFSERGPWVGNIGGDLLRRFTVYLDYAARQMILEPNASIADAFEIDMSGLGFVASGGEWTVEYVLPNAPGMEAGIERGDVVVAIDGRPVDGRAISELRKRFRRSGERTVLTIRRAGETKTLTVVTRRLV